MTRSYGTILSSAYILNKHIVFGEKRDTRESLHMVLSMPKIVYHGTKKNIYTFFFFPYIMIITERICFCVTQCNLKNAFAHIIIIYPYKSFLLLIL